MFFILLLLLLLLLLLMFIVFVGFCVRHHHRAVTVIVCGDRHGEFDIDVGALATGTSCNSHQIDLLCLPQHVRHYCHLTDGHI